ncbi:sensor histidine kinase [Thiorhodospira sibirica]|uniref:sensor histidine kinase n=1 Tax=Thiorhodospira sibirica TaxID=154347 RepID=UPI00022C1D37|nr:ATP-binding protein [Thiorhodospira sibirica]
MNQQIINQYTTLLVQYIHTQDEAILAEVSELARRLIVETIPPEEIGEMHQKATAQLADNLPANVDLKKALTLSAQPLIELLMAYGLLFRRDIEQHYSAMLNERLSHLQHLESIGILAAGIAHDFNNLLGIIIGYADLLQSQAEGPEVQWLENLLSAAFRGQQLVDRILSFARQEQHQTETAQADLVALVRETLELSNVNLPRAIELDFQATSAPVMVNVTPSQVQQVVLNLVTNAAQAMKGGGRLSVTVDIYTLQQTSLEHPTLQPGRYARLIVADTGHGIAPDVLPRIFDPFYTTREIGQGTGLGLSVVHGNITAMHGSIHVVSELGQGSTFTVLIPLLAAPSGT